MKINLSLTSISVFLQMFLQVFTFTALFAQVLTPATTAAVIPVVFTQKQKIEKLDSLITSLHQNKEFSGNILVAENNKIIYQKSLGIANESTKEPLNENAIFDLASVSKQFTAMAIVLLKEQKKLDYDNKLTDFFPELADYKDITIRNLLTHTSGLPDYMQVLDSFLFDKKWIKSRKIATNKDIIAVFGKYKPKVLFLPNQKYMYSNTGYTFLASIIEKVSKKTYAVFLRKNIFEPLKMNNSFVYTRRLAPKNIKNYAFGYVFSDSLKKNVLPDDVKGGLDDYVYFLDGIVGDGAVNSTTNDLFKWDNALYTEKLAPEKTLTEIFTPHQLNDNTIDYGFGWVINKNEVYGKIISHTGSWPGYKTAIERHLDGQKTIIILQNNDKTTNPSAKIRKILYSIPPTPFIKLEKKELDIFLGEYKNPTGKIRKILFEDDKMYVVLNEQTKMELKPISKTKFIMIGFSPEVQYEFMVVDGKVDKYVVSQAELNTKSEAIRIK